MDNIIKAANVVETPFYYYNIDVLRETLKVIGEESKKYNYTVHYAIKANANPKILKIIGEYGFGADCVSGNEILRALECGFEGKNIAFAGVGKSDREIEIGLDNDIFSFNCESTPEIEVINQLAKNKGKVANVALRINPNVAANTHAYITTGLEENKFGINFWELEQVVDCLENSKNLKLVGLHFHIGSQITDLNNFKGLCIRVNEIQQWFYKHGIIVDHINVGGGLGIDYINPKKNIMPDFVSYFKLFYNHLELRPKQKLHFELGRSVVGQCGMLVSRVLYVKNGIKKNFAILDAGMTELLRPALYQAHHTIENISSSKPEEVYDVVGPICESSDSFGKSISLSQTSRGDLIVIYSAGAYGEVMASNYNLRDNKRFVYSDEL